MDRPSLHVIVGAGQTGGHAALAMRQAGFVGRIVLIGDELERPYERPPLSKAALTSETEAEIAYFHTLERYRDAGIELMLGTKVAAIDPAAHRVLLEDGQNLPYDRLLLATGGRARHLSIPGEEHVLYLRRLDDARRIRARLAPGAHVVCIGAGVIGLEIASSARSRGCAVTVVEAGPGAMGRSLRRPFAEFIERLHRDAGVVLRFGASISAIEPDRVIVDGDAILADCVVAGIGMTRNTELAVAAGLAVQDGIVTDAWGRTSADDIFAAGDVAAFWHQRLGQRLRLESWRHAQNHGIAVGRVMAKGDDDIRGSDPYDDVPWFWTDQHGVNLQIAGVNDHTTRTVLRGAETAPSFAAFYLDDAHRVVAATGVNAPRDIRAAISLIRAGTPVDEAVLADPAIALQRLLVKPG